MQRGVAIETQAGKDIMRKCRDKAGTGRFSQKEVMSWFGTSVKFTLAVIEYYSRSVTGTTLAHLSHLVLIYKFGNNATRLSGEGKLFESEVCTCLSLCKCVHV